MWYARVHEALIWCQGTSVAVVRNAYVAERVASANKHSDHTCHVYCGAGDESITERGVDRDEALEDIVHGIPR